MSGKIKRLLSVLLVMSMILVGFTRCSGETDNHVIEENNLGQELEEEIKDENANEQITENDTENIPENDIEVGRNVEDADEVLSEVKNSENELTDIQKNSVSMLNYLTVLSQEINLSKNSRIYLEEAYSSLISNTNPNSIDGRTLVELNSLLDTLENYRMITVKRERLEYIYEQNQAKALKEALPNPIGLLGAAKSANLMQLVSSVAYMAVDSYSSYTAFTSENDLEYIKSGWTLDDEEAEHLHNSRKATFNYLVEMVNQYSLPGELALSEESVEDFVEWKNKSNVVSRIQFFESNEATYRAFGEYWLTLSRNYYENKDYEKCLEALKKYEDLDIHIFRRDYDYASVLPMAIVAAGEVLDEEDYLELAEEYAMKIVDNSAQGDWALRYFASQTFLDIYSRTKDKECLKRAYDIALDNVNILVDRQKELNEEYLADVQKVDIPKEVSKEEKKEFKDYNKMLVEERKTALPPVYKPLLLNCELLFGLANELDIDVMEQEKIDRILHENGEPIFSVAPLDDWYKYSSHSQSEEKSIEFDGKKLIVPAELVTEDSKIIVRISDSNGGTVIGDWNVKEVKRKSGEEISTFEAVYVSELSKEFKYADGIGVTIEIVPESDSSLEPLIYTFKAKAGKKFLVVPDLEFEQVKK